MDIGNARLVPVEEIRSRISKLQERLALAGIDLAVITQKADLFYFSGTVQQSHLLIPKKGEPVLMVKKCFERARAESPLRNIVQLQSFKDIGRVAASLGAGRDVQIGVEMDVIPARLYLQYSRVFNFCRLTDISDEIRDIRAQKSPWEIQVFKLVNDQLVEAMGKVKGWLREGMTELELVGELQRECRRLGHQGIIRVRSFNAEMDFVHVLSGMSGAIPTFFASATGGWGTCPAVPQGGSFKRIKRGEPIMIDMGGALEGYILDCTRMFCLGEPSTAVRKAFEVTLNIQAQVRNMLRPGVVCSEIFAHAAHIAREYGYERNFMGIGADQVSFVGHGIGLELDELPILGAGVNYALKPGNVIAVEPKIILPAEGAVGIENCYVITESGPELLTTTPDDMCVVNPA